MFLQFLQLIELGKKYSLSSSVIENMTKETRENIAWSEKNIDIITGWLNEFSVAEVWVNNISYYM